MQTEVETNDFTRFSPLGLCTFLLYDYINVEAITLAFDGERFNLTVKIPAIPVGEVFLAYLNSVSIMKLISSLLRRERMIFSRLLEVRRISLLSSFQVREEQPICSVYPVRYVLDGLRRNFVPLWVSLLQLG